MNTGFRPIRSATVAHNGIAANATKFTTMPTVNIVVWSILIVLTAYDSPYTPKMVLTVETRQARTTRTRSGM